MPYVEIDLNEIDTDDLIDALEQRGLIGFDGVSITLLNTIFEKRRQGKEYQDELDGLIHRHLGRIV